MKNLLYILLGLIVLFGTVRCMDNKRAKNYNTQTSVDAEALTFIKQGIEANLTEVKAANIALKNSANPRIISFANKLIVDHTAASTELKKIEDDKYVSGTDAINTEHEHMIKNLLADTGVAFDKAYISMMIPDHEEAIRLYESVDHNTSGIIQAFAKKTLPVLKAHLDTAKAINASLK